MKKAPAPDIWALLRAAGGQRSRPCRFILQPRPLPQAFPGAVPTHHQDIGLTCLPAQPLDVCGEAFAGALVYIQTVNEMLYI